MSVEMSKWDVLNVKYGDVYVIITKDGGVTIYGGKNVEVYYADDVKVAYMKNLSVGEKRSDKNVNE